jgi:hypothetical protein
LRKEKQISNEISKKHKAKRKAMYYILIEDINTIKLDIDVKLGG